MNRRKGCLLLLSVFFATGFGYSHSGAPEVISKEKPARSGHASLTGAHIGISKRFLYMGLSGGLPLVKTRFTIINYGDEVLNDLQVEENLNSVFGSGNYTHITDPNQVNGEGSSVTYNAAFDGNTDTYLLGVSSSLGVGESVTFEIQTRVNTITDQGHGSGIYHNQVTVTSIDTNENPVTDISQDGSDPDPDGDGDPSDNSDVSIINLNDNAAIGIAKDVSVTDNTVTFDFYLENLGNTTIESISFADNLQDLFGLGNYTLVSCTLLDNPGTITLNPNYDGAEDVEALDSTQSSLVAGDTAQIRMVMDIGLVTNAQSLGVGNYSNQVVLSGTSTGGFAVSDTSDYGTDPDPDADGTANEAGENDATTFTLSSTGRGGLALSASTTGTEVTYTYHVANLGPNTLSSVTLQDDLDAVFGSGNYTITAGPTLVGMSGLALNPSFNGSSDTDLLLSSSTLAGSATDQITLTVEVTESDQGNGVGIYDNQALLIATETTGLSFSDLSDSGTDPDTSANGDPGEAGEDDPTVVTVDGEPSIGIAKQATIVGALVYLDFAIENLGNSTLSSVALADDLDAVFGSGNYSISAQPSSISGPGTLTLSGAYTGTGGATAVVTDGTIAPGLTEVVRVVVQVTNITDQGFGLGIFNNSVTVSALSPASTAVNDVSDWGSNPDSNGNGSASDSGEDDATVITMGDETSIGVAKNVTLNGAEVTFDFYLENFGGSTISNLSLPDDLNAVLGSGLFSIVSGPTLIDNPGTITLNSSYDGDTSTNLLQSSSSLAALDTAQIQVVVQVNGLSDQGSGVGSYSNQVTLTGEAPLGSPASDLSDFGTDPDPNANMVAGDSGENDATTFTISAGQVGVAKTASVSGSEVTFLFTLENLGNAAPASQSLTDDLDAVLGEGTYTVTQGPLLTSIQRDLELNPNYDGSTDTNLISSGSTGAGQTETFTLKVEVNHLTDQGLGVGVYSNQASSNADGQIDLSDSGTNPDPDGDGTPDESGENDATSFSLTQMPVIGLAHDATENGSLITLDYYLENLGNVDLSNVAITDDLDAAFGSGHYHIDTAPAFVDNPGTLTLNSGFDGSTQTGLISSGTLAYGDTAQIRVIVEIDIPTDTGSGLGVYSNQATASATGPDSTATQDDSDDGTDPDPNGNGDPDETDENDATTINQIINSLGVAHSVSVSGGEVTLDFFLENLGNQTLTGLSLSSNLDTVFDAGTYTVTSAPTLMTTPQNLTLNATFDGSSDIQLLDSGTMDPGVFEQIRVVVLVHELVDQGSGFGVYSSQATGGADGPLSDLSDQGTNPDPNGNTRANDTGEDDATTFTLAENPVIGVSQTASVNGREVTFDCYLENLGNVPLSSITLPAPLNSLFGTDHFNIVTAPSLVDDPGTLTLNASYNGGTQPALISSGTLGVGDTARIQFTVEVLLLNDGGSGYGVYSSQVTVSGTGPDTTVVTDASDNGTNPDPDNDSNPDETNENDATPITISSGSIGDLSYNDLDGDGTLDGGEPGLEGPRYFVDINDNGVEDGIDRDSTSDANGAYLIPGLPVGTYDIYLDPASVPTGFVLTGGTESFTVTLTAGQNDLSQDLGFQQQDAQIGDLVWKDYDGDGVFDGGEPGIENVTVALYQDTNASGTLDGADVSLGSDTTDANGAYLFDLLPTGDYLVEVTDTNSVLVPFQLTGGTNPQAFQLAAGEVNLAVDFGYQRTDSSIGNLIWQDLDADGVVDGGEPGIEGVTLDLVDDLNDDGVLDGGEPVLDSTTSDANGAYLFEGLTVGHYLIVVTDTGNVLDGYVLTTTAEPLPVNLEKNQAQLDADLGYCLPVAISQQPADHTVCQDEDLVFSISTTGSSTITYQWYKDGDELVGETAATLTIAEAQPEDSGTYNCSVTNSCGTLISETVIGTVNVLSADFDYPVVVQGLDPLTLEVNIYCAFTPSLTNWTNLTLGNSFGAGENPVTLDGLLPETSLIQANVTDTTNGRETNASILALVSGDIAFEDLNGDGCNTPEDLLFLAPLWRGQLYDANGDGRTDLLDFLYIKIDGICP